MNIIDEYKRRRGDKPAHFFDRDTMRFFKSRLEDEIGGVGDSVYFLTSEQFVPSSGIPAARLYTVRVMAGDGDIETCGPFNELSEDRATSLAIEAIELRLTAEELARGRRIMYRVNDAKEMWDKAGGTLTPEADEIRKAAELLALEIGWRLVWNSLYPDVEREGKTYPWAVLVPYFRK